MFKQTRILLVVTLVILGMLFVSCSVLRGRKCNCPQWSKEIPVKDFDTVDSDAPKA